MKTRTDFVTNFSSTSYIIVLKDRTPSCPTCGHKPPDLVSIIEQVNDYETEVEEEGKKRVIEYIEEELKYEGSGSSWREKMEQTIERIKALPDSANVIAVDISYHNTMVQDLLEELVESGEAEILIDRG